MPNRNSVRRACRVSVSPNYGVPTVRWAFVRKCSGTNGNRRHGPTTPARHSHPSHASLPHGIQKWQLSTAKASVRRHVSATRQCFSVRASTSTAPLSADVTSNTWVKTPSYPARWLRNTSRVYSQTVWLSA